MYIYDCEGENQTDEWTKKVRTKVVVDGKTFPQKNFYFFVTYLFSRLHVASYFLSILIQFSCIGGVDEQIIFV